MVGARHRHHGAARLREVRAAVGVLDAGGLRGLVVALDRPAGRCAGRLPVDVAGEGRRTARREHLRELQALAQVGRRRLRRAGGAEVGGAHPDAAVGRHAGQAALLDPGLSAERRVLHGAHRAPHEHRVAEDAAARRAGALQRRTAVQDGGEHGAVAGAAREARDVERAALVDRHGVRPLGPHDGLGLVEDGGVGRAREAPGEPRQAQVELHEAVLAGRRRGGRSRRGQAGAGGEEQGGRGQGAQQGHARQCSSRGGRPGHGRVNGTRPVRPGATTRARRARRGRCAPSARPARPSAPSPDRRTRAARPPPARRRRRAAPTSRPARTAARG